VQINVITYWTICRNLNLRLMTKVRACKVVGQERSPRVKESVREWTFTLPRKLSLWELESWWILEYLESDRKGQKPNGLGRFFTIENILEHRCLKWACMTHLDIRNTSYGEKKGRELNWQFDFRPLKVKNRPDFFMCKWRATYIWKAFDEGYNFVLDLISIEGLHAKLWTPKVVGVRTMGILGLPFGNFGTKWHLGVGPMTRHKV